MAYIVVNDGKQVNTCLQWFTTALPPSHSRFVGNPKPACGRGAGEQTSGLLAATRTRMQCPHESPKHLFCQEETFDGHEQMRQPSLAHGCGRTLSQANGNDCYASIRFRF
jgi:hypothetical protein